MKYKFKSEGKNAMSDRPLPTMLTEISKKDVHTAAPSESPIHKTAVEPKHEIIKYDKSKHGH